MRGTRPRGAAGAPGGQFRFIVPPSLALAALGRGLIAQCARPERLVDLGEGIGEMAAVEARAGIVLRLPPGPDPGRALDELGDLGLDRVLDRGVFRRSGRGDGLGIRLRRGIARRPPAWPAGRLEAPRRHR